MPKVKYDNGQEEALSFLPLSNTERYKYIDLLVAGDTPGIIALCARRQAKWVDRLAPESFAELAGYFFREVFPMVMRMAERDPIASLKIAPVQLQLVTLMRQAERQGVDLEPAAGSGSALSPSSSTTPTSDATTGSASPSAPAPAGSAPGTPSIG